MSLRRRRFVGGVVLGLALLSCSLLLLSSNYGQGPLPLRAGRRVQLPDGREGSTPPPPEARILFKSRTFVPSPGLPSSTLDALLALNRPRVHAILQTTRIPTPAERALLEDLGVQWLQFIPARAYAASFPVANAPNIAAQPLIRAIAAFLPTDKIPARILASGVDPYARNPNGTIRLRVLFHSDVLPADAGALVLAHGGAVVDTETIPSLVVTADFDPVQLQLLAGEDPVAWVEDVSQPVALNDGSRASINVDAAQAPPYSLTGAGSVIGEWDGGHAVDNSGNALHVDLAGRVTNGDSSYFASNPFNSHATHVAGTAVGDGAGSGGLYRGMAPQASLVAYDWNDFVNERAAAIANHDIDIASNSFSMYMANGYYSSYSSDIDRIVRGGSGKKISEVWAAGNFNVGCDKGDYDCVLSTGQTAKNSITVGAVQSQNHKLRPNSARGPTDDGRIKPDVVAAGCENGSDYVIVPRSTSLDTQTAITITAWIRPEVDNNYATRALVVYTDTFQGWYFNNNPPAVYPYGVCFYQNAGFDKLWTNLIDTTTSYHAFNTGFAFTSGNWYHVAVTYDQATGDAALYVDGGAVVATQHYSPSFALRTSYDVYIGAHGIKEEVNGYHGTIDEVRIYGQALTQADIIDEMNGAPISPTPVLYLPMDEGSGQTVHDASGHGNDGYLGESDQNLYDDPAWLPSGSCKVGSSCLHFDAGHDVITSTTPGSNYGGNCGTSMAAPAVSGSLALLLQQWRMLPYGPDPWPSTLKAVLVHTTDDLELAGPDYRTGWGVLNVANAAQLMLDDNGTHTIIKERTTGQGQSHLYEFTLANNGPLEATLVWDDVEGAVWSQPSLVNDLDLRLVDPNGNVYRPYVLDPATPQNPATTGINHIDNVEQVRIANASSGTWRGYVDGSSVPLGPHQDYSLILRCANPHTPPLHTINLCPPPAGQSTARSWISLPNYTPIGTAKDLCAAIGSSAVTVSQLFGDTPNPDTGLGRRWTYNCATGSCTPGSTLTPPYEPGNAIECFSIDDGEGYEVETNAATSFPVEGCESPVPIALPAGTNTYLVSVPFDTWLVTWQDLANSLGVPALSQITGVNECTGAATSVLAGSAAASSAVLVKGRAYRIRLPNLNGLTYTNPTNGTGPCPAACP